tara:strand:- start:600 stop:1769 length:1170 start_codon:yes stop_codon:yes gene_type:complete
MNALKQIGSITLISLQSLPQRWGPALVVVVGMTAAVGIIVSVLSMAVGMTHSMDDYMRPDRVMVLRSNAQFEGQSSISREDAIKIADKPGIKIGGNGKPIASPEILVGISAKRRLDGLEKGLSIRAGTPDLLELRPEFNIIEGRMFHPGLHEVIAGRALRDHMQGIDLNAKVRLPDGEWTIVGIYGSGDGGDKGEWALFGDSETMLPTFNFTTFQSMTLMLESVDSFETFNAAVEADPTLDVSVQRETKYWGDWLEPQIAFYNIIAYWIGGIMILGALFGALNTMYAAVSTRIREIGTLRAMGFGPTPVVISIFIESLLLAGSGALVGLAIAWTSFNGITLVGRNFDLLITPGLAASGLGLALAVGVLGALFPAIRAARLPVATALQSR